jgi:hypothetical protein
MDFDTCMHMPRRARGAAGAPGIVRRGGVTFIYHSSDSYTYSYARRVRTRVAAGRPRARSAINIASRDRGTGAWRARPE